MIRYDHYTDKFVKVSDKECPWCKAVCASTDKYCHECGWHIADAPQTEEQNLDCRNKGYYSSCEYKDNCNTTVCHKAFDELKSQLKTEQTDCAWMYDSRRDYEYDMALDELERNE